MTGVIRNPTSASAWGDVLDVRRIPFQPQRRAPARLSSSHVTTWIEQPLPASRPHFRTQAGLASIPRNTSTAAFGSVLDYNGPIPLPSLDEYILVHRVIRGLFLRNGDIWNIYKARPHKSRRAQESALPCSGSGACWSRWR